MTSKRARHVGATAALILFLPGGASAAADTDVTAKAGLHRTRAALTAPELRQRRVEDAWLAQQLRAEARARSR
jgi:hypothetical protein